jgi:preprotein translocase subunit YajC
MWLLLGQAAPDPQAQGGGLMSMILPLAAIALIWYFLVLRPQSKAEKARRAKLDALEKGDKVRTRGGIEGVVVRVQDDKVIVKIDVDGKVHVPFSKTFIDEVLTDAPAEDAKDSKESK